MKIKCIYNQGAFLPRDIFRDSTSYNEKTLFCLIPGKEYNVYAMTIYLGYPWYYICDENYSYYPRWNPAPLFDVTDSRISRYWVYTNIRGSNQLASFATWAYPEWAFYPSDYYDALTDKDEMAVKVFQRYKLLMDLEFPDQSVPITSTATLSSDKLWFICPECFESWESQKLGGMVQCPKCQKVLHNPLYQATAPGLDEQAISALPDESTGGST